jgi:hypothetical protein
MAQRRVPAGAVSAGGRAMMLEQGGPAGATTGPALNTTDARQGTLFAHALQAGDGEARKLHALGTLGTRYPDRVRHAQAALVRLLLARGECTVDDVRGLLRLPDAEPTRWLGCVPGELRRAGIIRRAGFVESRRAVAHARPVSVWELADRAAAERWLRGHVGPAASEAI